MRGEKDRVSQRRDAEPDLPTGARTLTRRATMRRMALEASLPTPFMRMKQRNEAEQRRALERAQLTPIVYDVDTVRYAARELECFDRRLRLQEYVATREESSESDPKKKVHASGSGAEAARPGPRRRR
ncbi:hypothetical protein GMRT_jh012 [Giardia muris]|uniref:Uncharacterized protein n=1 Tax=Giardia muris TaxID=5742 RepID=A0A4Z1TAQ2_GIAMU|nr:hypothetical protein GMRT_jh012 [Giardia muris]|eukprot:TNJ29591.1 hypothetical protein GMRT_jh012 [Giardia muris]